MALAPNRSVFFGQYCPGASILHRLDPRIKLFLTLLCTIAIFSVLPPHFLGLALCSCFVGAFCLLSGLGILRLVKSIAPLSFIIIITALITIFYVQGGTVYLSFGSISISEAGITQAVFIAWRLVLLLTTMSLLTLTTTTLDLTDAFESVFNPAKRLGMPVHELAMMMSIALRFLPLFALELKTIYRAQISRGAAIKQGKLRVLASLVIPLFTSAFRRAETLSYAMDARCYNGGIGRTRLHASHPGKWDWCAVGVVVAMLAVSFVSNFA